MIDTMGIVLTGGGARAAYQAGVLRGVAEITGKQENHFPIICGTSAGAINAVALACSPHQHFLDTTRWIENLWLNLNHDNVYRSDGRGVLLNLWRLLRTVINKGKVVGRPVALLDNLPLKTLLHDIFDFDNIRKNIHKKHLEAISVTAVNYSDGESISFFEGGPEHIGWSRWRRRGVPTRLELRHLMGSTAIPTVFPPQRIGRNYFGDGALRQLNPVSPALHLGANKIFIISTSGYHQNYRRVPKQITPPSFGQVMGNLFNSAFVDNLDHDVELMGRINSLLDLVPDEEINTMHPPLNPIDHFIISPSEDIDMIANNYVSELPPSMQRLLSITGSKYTQGGVNIASYLLFNRNFAQALIDLGYNDAMSEKDKVREFFTPSIH